MIHIYIKLKKAKANCVHIGAHIRLLAWRKTNTDKGCFRYQPSDWRSSFYSATLPYRYHSTTHVELSNIFGRLRVQNSRRRHVTAHALRQLQRTLSRRNPRWVPFSTRVLACNSLRGWRGRRHSKAKESQPLRFSTKGLAWRGPWLCRFSPLACATPGARRVPLRPSLPSATRPTFLEIRSIVFRGLTSNACSQHPARSFVPIKMYTFREIVQAARRSRINDAIRLFPLLGRTFFCFSFFFASRVRCDRVLITWICSVPSSTCLSPFDCIQFSYSRFPRVLCIREYEVVWKPRHIEGEATDK